MALYIQTIKAVGASGEKYSLLNFPLGDEIPYELEGIYLFSRYKGELENWEIVFIGNGNIKEETDKLIKEGCVIEKGATHIMVHVDNDEKSQIRKKIDMIEGNPECYEPYGYNIK